MAGSLLAAAEIVLRLVGFEWQPIPERIWVGRLAGGIPTGEVVFDRFVAGLFTRDALLFWRPVAGRPPFNAAGLRDDEETPVAKPAGEIRVLALGDSCTFLGEPVPWPERLEDRLDAGGGGRRVRVLNAGVPAWSSLQGRRYLERRGLAFAPDLVILYFGWNDHWRATSRPDADFQVPGEGTVTAQRLLGRLRLYQALNRLLKGERSAPGIGPPPEVLARADDLARDADRQPFRVPLADFEANLRAMIDAGAAAGARSALITAPSTLRAGQVPDYLMAHGFVARGGEPVDAIHARYADAVRRVAAARGALLVDAERAFASAPDGGASWMRADGIHLTAAGIEALADQVAAGLSGAGLP